MTTSATKTRGFIIFIGETSTLSNDGWVIFEVLNGIFKGGVFEAYISCNLKSSFFKGGV